MCNFTRREILQILAMALPVSLLGCWKNKDVFYDEHVCVHVFAPTISIPEPLLKRYDNIPTRTKLSSVFNIGIPELLICTTSSSFRDLFQYFWPITREEFHEIQRLISVKFDKSEIDGKEDIEDFARYLENRKGELRSGDIKSAIILTFNDYTRYWSSHLINLWQNQVLRSSLYSKIRLVLHTYVISQRYRKASGGHHLNI